VTNEQIRQRRILRQALANLEAGGRKIGITQIAFDMIEALMVAEIDRLRTNEPEWKLPKKRGKGTGGKNERRKESADN
jgi:hypothetical protein